MSEEEIMQGINKTLTFMKEELKTQHSCFAKKELDALNGLLDLYNQEKRKNKKLKTLLYQIRNELRWKVIIKEDGIYKPCKNLTKQEVYESYVKLNLMLKANYVFKNNEEAIEELLKEGE